jgi:hypothetical protein
MVYTENRLVNEISFPTNMNSKNGFVCALFVWNYLFQIEFITRKCYSTNCT